ncbi:MAG: FGGY-family carbohydrate kinase, partial [Planctomycetaceae bacterium]|nr:FGGY-family carbohydrate kinase [Planctomycetaceae bacterium]
SATSAANLEWFVSQFFEGDRELLKLRGSSQSTGTPADNTGTPADNIYDYCAELVAQTQPDESAMTFLPYLYGGPVSLDAKGVLFGLDGRQTRGYVMRAVFEGIIFGHRWHVERLLRFWTGGSAAGTHDCAGDTVGTPTGNTGCGGDTHDCAAGTGPQTIRLTGGATNSEVWAQMFADIFQIPVEIPAGTELGCLGAAICGAVAGGIYPDYEEACRNMVTVHRVYQPNPALAEVYAKKYERYLKLLEVLAPAWAVLK